jgi:NitT/TauT family transport system substrate-binding protein
VALEKPDIVIGAPSGVSSAALFIAQDDGLFRKAGLHVKIEALGASGPALPELLDGQVDVLEYPWTAIIEADAAGTARLHAIAGAQSLGPRLDEILVLPRSGITTVAQLRGKTIGVPSPGGLDAMLVDSVLADCAVGPSQAHLVPVGAQDLESALATHRVDAIEPGEPLVTLIEEELGAVGLRPAAEGQRESQAGVVDAIQQPPQTVEHAQHPPAGVGRPGHDAIEQAVVPVVVADQRRAAIKDCRLGAAGEKWRRIP